MSLLTASPLIDSDEPVAPWRATLAPDVVRRLSTLRPLPTLGHLALEWVLVAAAVFASRQLWAWNVYAGIAGYVAAVVWIGSRQHALAILMHEAAHYRLFKNRTLNDVCGELCLGWPLLISMRIYRLLHFAHHRSPNTADDPDWLLRLNRDWAFPKTRGELLKVFALDVFGLHLRDQLEFFGRYAFNSEHRKTWLDAAAILFFASLIAALTYFQLWLLFLAYWVVPLMTWLKVVLRMRTIGEHYGLEYDHTLRQTRTTYPSLAERLLIAPKNIAYHLDHHLYPSVPFYNLPRLHAELLRDDEFRRQAHLTTTYATVLDECRHCIGTPS